MTSQLNVDTIVDKAGSGGTNVKIGNTSTYVSENSAATQNTVQGLVKQWDKFNQETPAVLDSFNQSSLTDRATGKTQHNFTNVMNSTHYAVSGIALDEGEAQAVMDGCDDDFTDSAKYQVNTFSTDNTARDCDKAYTMCCGDLA